MKKSIIGLIVTVFFLAPLAAFAAEPIPMDPGATAGEVQGIVKKSGWAVSSEIQKKMREEEGREMVRDKKTLEAIQGVGSKVDGLGNTITQAIDENAQHLDESIQAVNSGISNLQNEVRMYRNGEELNGKKLDDLKTIVEASNVSSEVEESTGIITGYIWRVSGVLSAFLLGIAALVWFTRRRNGDGLASVNLATNKLNSATEKIEAAFGSFESDIASIGKDVARTRAVVIPEPFMLKFSVNGQIYEYDVPVDDRGRYISLFAPSIEPDDQPETPADVVRSSYTDRNSLKQSCRSAVKNCAKPDCEAHQKDLVVYLLGAKQLRKIKS